MDVDGTLETDAITLAGAAINAASGIVTLDSNSIVKGKRLGTWASKSDNTVYQAATDGFLTGYATGGGSGTPSLEILTDASNPPTTVRSKSLGSGNSDLNNASSPVKKSDYYKFLSADSSATALYFIPSGD
jgi:hypothetical protein